MHQQKKKKKKKKRERQKIAKARRGKQVTYKRTRIKKITPPKINKNKKGTTIKQHTSHPQTKEVNKPFINICKVLRENKHSLIILHQNYHLRMGAK